MYDSGIYSIEDWPAPLLLSQRLPFLQPIAGRHILTLSPLALVRASQPSLALLCYNYFVTMANAARNLLAKQFKALHKPHQPIILANVYDGASAKAVASLSTSKAIATASYAVAEAAGMKDNDLTREENIRAAKAIASSTRGFGKPLTVDLQDGYGAYIGDAVKELINEGIVGINLEDFDNSNREMYSLEEATDRIKQVLSVATTLGVSDFVINARCDTLLHGGSLDEVIARGKFYIAAGATTVFVLGGASRGGISRDEIIKLVDAFDGRLNVSMKLSNGLNVKELSAIGVSRISVGPALQFAAMEKIKDVAKSLLAY